MGSATDSGNLLAGAQARHRADHVRRRKLHRDEHLEDRRHQPRRDVQHRRTTRVSQPRSPPGTSRSTASSSASTRPRNNLNDILQQINASSAGVYATYDAANDRVLLTAKADGPQGITIGAAGRHVELLAGRRIPDQLHEAQSDQRRRGRSRSASRRTCSTSTTPARRTTSTATRTTSRSVVPGVDLKLQQAVDGTVVAPVTISVAQDSTALQTAIKTFVTAYNAVIDEINTATQAPVVGTTAERDDRTEPGHAAHQPAACCSTTRTCSAARPARQHRHVVRATPARRRTTRWPRSVSRSTPRSPSATAVGEQHAEHQLADERRARRRSPAPAAGSTTSTSASSAPRWPRTRTPSPSSSPARTSIVGQLGAYLTRRLGSVDAAHRRAGRARVRRSRCSRRSRTQTNDQITSLQQQIKLVTDQANLQADQLRREFVNSETQIAQLQAMQSSLGALTKTTRGNVTLSNANLRYLEASINSASPEELIIKVYDALLLFARQAIEVMEIASGRHPGAPRPAAPRAAGVRAADGLAAARPRQRHPRQPVPHLRVLAPPAGRGEHAGRRRRKCASCCR